MLARRAALAEKIYTETKGGGKPNWGLGDTWMGCPLRRGVAQQASNPARDEWVRKRPGGQDNLAKEIRKDKEFRAALEAQGKKWTGSGVGPPRAFLV